MFTPYHSKYTAHDLTKLAPPGSDDQLSMSLFDASVDLNPHQIEAAMFALQSPLAEGAILADEVGLGVSAGLCPRRSPATSLDWNWPAIGARAAIYASADKISRP